MIETFMGYKIVSHPALTKTVEDWSKVRSPGRARRRMKRGFRQNIALRAIPDPDIYVLDGSAYMHPETYEVLVLRARDQGVGL